MGRVGVVRESGDTSVRQTRGEKKNGIHIKVML